MEFSQEASQKMMEIAASARVAAKRAEEEYERHATRAEELASDPFRLGDSHMAGRIADIVSAAKKACETLYMAYQNLVQLVDEECRPLLEQNPDPKAVREVRNLIRWLNEESEIENNYSASLNATDLGDLVCVRFSPTPQSRMIQALWDNKYSMWPGREEMERQEAEEERRRRTDAAQKARELYRAEHGDQAQAKARYEQDMAAWREKVSQVRWLRDEETKRLCLELEQRLSGPVEAQCDREIGDAQQRKTKAQQDRAELLKQLETLGVLQIGQKMKVKKVLKALEEELLKLETSISGLKSKKSRMLRDVKGKVEQQRPELRKQAESRYPMPEEPCPPGMTRQDMDRIRTEDAILETLKQHGRLSMEQLLEKCPALSGMTENRLRAILRKMAGVSVFEEYLARRYYYSCKTDFRRGGGLTPEQQANRNAVLSVLKKQSYATVAEIADETGMTNQRTHATLVEMCKEGLVVRYEYDRKVWFEIF